MRERGIIFNAEMVRALLNGSKTQTRRIIKNVMPDNCLWLKKPTKTKSGIATHVIDAPSHGLCAYGQPSDRLWVRETWAMLGNEDRCAIDWNENLVKGGGPEAARIYRASCEQRPGNYGMWSIPDDAFWKPHTDDMQYDGKWTPSIHMPRWASRITLEITGVRVERLNAISGSDALKEGLHQLPASGRYCIQPGIQYFGGASYSAKEVYSWLWESIYGDGSWQANPWVWVIEFKRVEDAE